MLKKVIKDAKIHYYRTHFEQCKNDSKKTWKVIKNVLHKSKSDNLPDSFIIDDQTVHSYGYDNFSTNLLKKLAPLLSAPLTLIITHQ